MTSSLLVSIFTTSPGSDTAYVVIEAVGKTTFNYRIECHKYVKTEGVIKLQCKSPYHSWSSTNTPEFVDFTNAEDYNTPKSREAMTLVCGVDGYFDGISKEDALELPKTDVRYMVAQGDGYIFNKKIATHKARFKSCK